MTTAGFVLFTIFAIRGLLGFIQDANYFYDKEFSVDLLCEWWDNIFKRNIGDDDEQ